MGAPPVQTSGSGVLPVTTMLVFDAANLDAILKKLTQFNEQLASNDSTLQCSLQADGMNPVKQMVGTLKQKHYYHASTISQEEFLMMEQLLQWPTEHLFPCLDILRLLMLHPAVAQWLQSKSAPLLQQLRSNCSLQGPQANC